MHRTCPGEICVHLKLFISKVEQLAKKPIDERYYIALLYNEFDDQKISRFSSKYVRMNLLQSNTILGSLYARRVSSISCSSTKNPLQSSTIYLLLERFPSTFLHFLNRYFYVSLLFILLVISTSNYL